MPECRPMAAARAVVIITASMYFFDRYSTFPSLILADADVVLAFVQSAIAYFINDPILQTGFAMFLCVWGSLLARAWFEYLSSRS